MAIQKESRGLDSSSDDAAVRKALQKAKANEVDFRALEALLKERKEAAQTAAENEKLAEKERQAQLKSCAVLGWPLPGVAKEEVSKQKDDAPAKDPAKPGAAPSPAVKSADAVTDPKSPDPSKKTGDAPALAADKAISYRVSLEPTIFLHDHVMEFAENDPTKCTPETNGVTAGNVTITKKDEAKPKEDPNTIKVSGQVTLPKAADSTAQK